MQGELRLLGRRGNIGLIQRYLTSTCERSKQMKSEGSSDKPKLAPDFPSGDLRARRAFINKIATPVAIKMFEFGIFAWS